YSLAVHLICRYSFPTCRATRYLHSFPTRRSSDLAIADVTWAPIDGSAPMVSVPGLKSVDPYDLILVLAGEGSLPELSDDERAARSEEHTSELQSRVDLVCRLLLEKNKNLISARLA